MNGKNYSENEAKLLDMLNNKIHHFDADGDSPQQAIQRPSNQASMTALKGNPPFIGQFNINVLIRYYSVAAGVFTSRTAAYILANAATLATRLAGFFFSQADFAGGYTKSIQQFPLAANTWSYGVPFVFGAQPYPAVNGVLLDATAQAQLQGGDIIIPFYGASGGVNYQAHLILRCDEVNLGTLVAALNSDKFTINDIRYTLTDTTTAGLTQYRNQLLLLTQTFLGLFSSDKVPVNAMKNPEQFQGGIVDVPIVKKIDKNTGFGTYINYDQTDSMSLGFFIDSIEKQ